ncbi:MAG: CoA transferase [Deltaproteobacteria bacterium]|nr:CoA transferase [Deltaproteobacteria bacterium]
MAEPFVALRGIRVLDLSRLLPGPYLTRLLSDLGADVVKVEPPEGDGARFLPPAHGSASAAFVALNFGKRSLVLDLKTPPGAEVLLAMLPQVDVVVESFRPGVLARLGVGADVMHEANPRLVVCSVTGFGQVGARRHLAGHDLGYLAAGGLLSLFGPRPAPAVPGVQIADLAGGALSAAVGILAALLERERTGRGRHLDVSMARSSSAFVAVELARRAAGEPEPRGEGLLTGGVPCYAVYRTRDNRFMALAALEPKFFAAFCERAGSAHLAGEGLLLGSAGDPAREELARIFASRTQAEWVALLAGSDCCCEPVRTPEEALADPGLGIETADVAGLPCLRAHLGAPAAPLCRAAAPELGEHSLEVVKELGVAGDLVERAIASGALRPGARP